MAVGDCLLGVEQVYFHVVEDVALLGALMRKTHSEVALSSSEVSAYIDSPI